MKRAKAHHKQMPQISFVTCREVGGITPDDRIVANELATLGVQVSAVSWDERDGSTETGAFVIRSPWNYHLEPAAFLDWVETAARSVPVFNDPEIVRWNAHKAYLLDLEAAGIPIAPTMLCRAHDNVNVARVMEERSWHEIVIKPAISASSYMTAIVGATPHPALLEHGLDARFITDGQQHLDRILESRDALIQPFLPEIFTRGERSLIYIGGAFSHCVQKDAFTTGPGGGHAAEADEVERDIAARALATLPKVPLYARVDLLRNAEGREHLMELELIDPELYMRYDPRAPRRFAAAMLAYLEETHA